MQRQKRFPGERASWAAIEYSKEPDQRFQYAFVFFLTALLIAGFGFASIAKISVTVTAKGRLITKNPPVPIRSPQKMSVQKLHVAENQKVVKGQILVSSVEAIDQANLSKVQSYLRTMLGIVRRAQASCSSCISELRQEESLYRSIQIQGDLMSALSTVQDNGRELSLSLEERAALPTITKDARLQIELDRRKLDTIVKRKAQAILAKEYEALTADLVANQTKIDDRKQKSSERVTSAISKIQTTASDLMNKIQYLGGQFEVRAPIDGVVTNLSLKGVGEVLQVGQELMSLIPAGDPLIAELEIRNRDIAETRNGLKADIKVDSMPEFEYGTLTGKIYETLRLDRDPASEKDKPDIRGSTFVVHADLNDQRLFRGGQPVPLISGMTVKADIISRQETILHIVIRALFELKDDFKVEDEQADHAS